MPFWDVPYKMMANKAIIGFDIDQTKLGKGFVLEWNAVDNSIYDFTDVYESHDFLQKFIESKVRDLFFAKDKGKFTNIIPL